MDFYRIADLPVCYHAFYPMLRTRSQKYVTAPSDDAVLLSVTPAQIESIRDRTPLLDDDMREYMLMGKYYYEMLITHDGMMLHASAVVVDNRAFLFSAPSGTGKSTHTSLWLKLFGERAYILNDDKPAIRIMDGCAYAYGTPFSGKYDISENRRVPIAGVAFIERSETNSIERMPSARAVFSLLNQTARPESPDLYARLLRNLDAVLQCVPVYTLHCNMDIEAAAVSYDAMLKGSTV